MNNVACAEMLRLFKMMCEGQTNNYLKPESKQEKSTW